RRLLMVTQAAQACTALAVAALVATGVIAYWHVGILALCSGLANTLFNVVKQSFVIETVGRDDVGNAVALSSAAFNGARIVGPAEGHDRARPERPGSGLPHARGGGGRRLRRPHARQRRATPPAAGASPRQRGRRVRGAGGIVHRRERLAQRDRHVPARLR